MFYSIYLFLGSLYLLILTVQDYRSMTVDSKYNYILVGVGISLLSHVSVSFWYVLSLIAGLAFINFYGRRSGVFGAGDFSAFSWLFLGLGFINPFILAYYFVVLVLLSLFYLFARKRLSGFRVSFVRGRFSFYRVVSVVRPVPFYPVIFGSWLLTLPLLL